MKNSFGIKPDFAIPALQYDPTPTGESPRILAAAGCNPANESGQQVAGRLLGPQRQMTRKVHIGIDNGFTGAMALLDQNQIFCRPVPVINLGKYRLLDVSGCTELLQEMIAMAQTPLENVLAVFEQSSIVPKFGAKNNYLNGQNNEFWRVLLFSNKVPFAWVNAQEWQKHIFAGIRGTNTAAKAELVRRQRFPNYNVSGLKKSEIEGVNDALCIALWARETRGS